MLSELTDSAIPEAMLPAPLIAESGAERGVATPSYCRIRADLRASLQTSDGGTFYLVEDPYHGRFYRLGVAEWQLASLLDGKTPLGTAVKRCEQEGRVPALSSEKAASLCSWLVQSHLATIWSADSENSNLTKQLQRAKPASGGFNPFYIKIPLLRPDKLLTRILPVGKVFLTRAAFVLWLVLCLLGADLVLCDWKRFAQSAALYLSPETWFWLAGVWMGLKIVHETFHGLVCKKFDGFVSEAGLVLILFSPVAYVDVTSSWRFRDKWARIFTSAAGMYAEFAIAAVAAIIWAWTETGVINYVCHSIVMTASVTTVLFNANPLMRFDGYYILADLIEIQNLYSVARQSHMATVQRVIFGKAVSAPSIEGWKRGFIAVYGHATAVWRVLVTAGLLIGAAALFHGAGVIMAAFGFITWIAVPFLQTMRNIMMPSSSAAAGSRRRPLIIGGLAAGVIAAVLLSPRPGGVTVPAIVAYADLHVVRAETRGFVEQVHVQEGQKVTTGTLLVTLRGDDVRAELRDVELQWEQSELKARSMNGENEIAASQAELERLGALTERRDQLRKQVAQLAIRAPAEAVVLDAHLDHLLGTFIEVGQPVIHMAVESQKEVQVSIPETAYDAFAKQIGVTPTVRIRGVTRSIHAGPLAKVEPKANTLLRHDAWAAPYGGPLPVRASANSGEERAESEFRLVAPRFHGVIVLPPETAERLRDGQVGDVKLDDAHESVGQWAYRTAANWAYGKHQARGGQ